MMATKLTVESLGSDATEQDLSRYLLTIERILPAFDDQEAAEEWLWNNGDFMARIDAGICAYCDRLSVDGTTVPAVADDDAWSALATEHDADCEWIATRAHRA